MGMAQHRAGCASGRPRCTCCAAPHAQHAQKRREPAGRRHSRGQKMREPARPMKGEKKGCISGEGAQNKVSFRHRDRVMLQA